MCPCFQNIVLALLLTMELLKLYNQPKSTNQVYIYQKLLIPNISGPFVGILFNLNSRPK